MSHEALSRIDEIVGRALKHAGLTDRLTYAWYTIEGYFERRWVEQGTAEGVVGGYVQTFDCRAEDVPKELEQNDGVEIEGECGTFFFQRKEPAGTGRVLLYLGTKR